MLQICITVNEYIAAWYGHVVGALEHPQELTLAVGGWSDWLQRQVAMMMRMMK